MGVLVKLVRLWGFSLLNLEAVVLVPDRVQAPAEPRERREAAIPRRFCDRGQGFEEGGDGEEGGGPGEA